MRKTTLIVVGICLAGSVALGDSLTVNNIPYSNVRITDVAGLKVSYVMSGSIRQKSLTDVSFVVVSSNRDFNKAEDAFKKGKAAEAVAAYNDAEKNAGTNRWIKRLINYRRMQAAAAAKMPGQAIVDWLAIVDETGASRSAIALGPNAVAAKGSSENAKAIAMLEKRIGGKEDPIFRAKVRDLLLNLYQTEGLKDKALMLSGSAPVSETPGTSARLAAPGTGASGMNVSVGQSARQLQEAASQFKLGNYDAAVADIEAKLNRFSSADLPGALLLHGKALQMSYKKAGSKDIAKLKRAGLSFMRAAACFDPTTPEAPEALYYGAMVSRELGNGVAAANALRLLVNRYQGGKWAERAQQVLGGGGQ